MDDQNLLVVAHDAGAAQIIFYWLLKHHADRLVFLHVRGPARQLFESYPGNAVAVRDYKTKGWKQIVTGTSNESQLELDAIIWGNECGTPVISFLDHWDNYVERFTYRNRKIYPAQIAVGDKYAETLAVKVGIPKNLITFIPNAYLAYVSKLEETKRPSTRTSLHILYCLEGVSRTLAARFPKTKQLYDDEFVILHNFIFETCAADLDISITFRLHPADEPEKYEECFQSISSNIVWARSNSKLLVDDVLWSDIVVGAETMALVVGLYMKKMAYSYITGKQYPISLPFREIKDRQAYLGLLRYLTAIKR